jgi:hypothetical protein
MKNNLTNEIHDEEAKVIAVVITALGCLEDNRKIEVLEFIIRRISGTNLPQREISPRNSIGSQAVDLSIKDFLKQKNTENKYQQVAVLAYFLKKNKGEDFVNKEIIEAANLEAGGKTIDDITGTLNDAKSKYGFFGLANGGKKTLLAYGEDVVEALPDREKVKELRKKNHSRKRRAKKITKDV